VATVDRVALAAAVARVKTRAAAKAGFKEAPPAPATPSALLAILCLDPDDELGDGPLFVVVTNRDPV